MEKFRDSIIREITMELIVPIIVTIVLIIAFFLAHRFLKWAEIPRAQVLVYIVLILLFLLNSFWTYSTVSKLFLDLSENSFETYIGEVEFMDQKSSKLTDVFRLSDMDDVYLECGYGSIEATIQRCEARVVYAKHSKRLLEIEVYEVLETRSPVVIS